MAVKLANRELMLVSRHISLHPPSGRRLAHIKVVQRSLAYSAVDICEVCVELARYVECMREGRERTAAVRSA